MTDRLRLVWPDPRPFATRDGRPLRFLAVSDETDDSLDSEQTRAAMGAIDMVIGCGDLPAEYLAFLADAFRAPLHYVRGNHDAGQAWDKSERTILPVPLPDGHLVEESGLRIVGFSGSPRYSRHGVEFSSTEMWLRALSAWRRARGEAPVLMVSHTPPRDVGDDEDVAHRGFTAFRWLAQRLHPPLWLHGHTALVKRGIDGRCARLNGTLVYNCTGATLVELVAPRAAEKEEADA